MDWFLFYIQLFKVWKYCIFLLHLEIGFPNILSKDILPNGQFADGHFSKRAQWYNVFRQNVRPLEIVTSFGQKMATNSAGKTKVGLHNFLPSSFYSISRPIFAVLHISKSGVIHSVRHYASKMVCQILQGFRELREVSHSDDHHAVPRV